MPTSEADTNLCLVAVSTSFLVSLSAMIAFFMWSMRTYVWIRSAAECPTSRSNTIYAVRMRSSGAIDINTSKMVRCMPRLISSASVGILQVACFFFLLRFTLHHLSHAGTFCISPARCGCESFAPLHHLFACGVRCTTSTEQMSFDRFRDTFGFLHREWCFLDCWRYLLASIFSTCGAVVVWRSFAR